MFLIYSIVGWFAELLLFLIEDKVLVNRGFLFGPWLPIYGFGGLIVFYLFNGLIDKKVHIKNINIRPVLLIVYISLMCCLVELLGTYLLELFGYNFKELWDYSKVPFNFEGRIALWPTIRFGILGTTFLYYFQPGVEKLLLNIKKHKGLAIIMNILIFLFLVDLTIKILF